MQSYTSRCWLPSAGQATVTESEVLASPHCLPITLCSSAQGLYAFPAQGADSGPHTGPRGSTFQMRRLNISISFLARHCPVKLFRMKWYQSSSSHKHCEFIIQPVFAAYLVLSYGLPLIF